MGNRVSESSGAISARRMGRWVWGSGGKSFPQASLVNVTLTEKIHSYRIAASEGPICSKGRQQDEFDG